MAIFLGNGFDCLYIFLCLLRGGVHYRDKETVSWRLSLSGLAVAYNQNVSRYRGPYPTMSILDLALHVMTVEYDDGAAALTVHTTDGFEVSDKVLFSCSDRQLCNL